MKETFVITPIFDYIKEQMKQAGLHINYQNSKETLQLFLNEKSYNNKEKYIGAIQYEGSNDLKNKEPHLVSLRFKRSNIPIDLKHELESITSFRRDKNIGPKENPSAESIAFKFEFLNEVAKESIKEIVKVLKNMQSRLSRTVAPGQ